MIIIRCIKLKWLKINIRFSNGWLKLYIRLTNIYSGVKRRQHICMKVYFGKYLLHCRDMSVGNFDIGIQTLTRCDYAAESLAPIFAVADRCDE